MSERAGVPDDSFEAFASSRLNSPKGSLPQKLLRTSPTSSNIHRYFPVNNGANNNAQALQTGDEAAPPPLPPRKPLRTSVSESYSDGWLHRGQELAVHKEAYLLSQTGVASLQRGREGESKRTRVSPDPHATSSETSDSLGIPSKTNTNVTADGFTSEEKLKKFKYEPLEDESDRWGGMLFEQDLYGRTCRGNYGHPKVNRLSLSAEDTPGNKITSVTEGPKILPYSDTFVADILPVPSPTPSAPDAKSLDVTTAPVEEMESCPPETNNVSFSSTSGDLNRNVNNSDFGFIDSDGSSQSDVGDTLKGAMSLGGTFPPPAEASQIAAYHVETATAPGDVFTLKDTYIPEMNSSFEVTASSNKLYNVFPVCKDNSVGGVIKTQRESDGNGNPLPEVGAQNQKETFPGVVSARLRPKGVSRQNSPSSQSKARDGEFEQFEQFLCLVQNISEAREGPLSYQPSKSSLSSLQADSSTHHSDPDAPSRISPQANARATDRRSDIPFEALHAQVAPNPRTPSKSKTGQSLHKPSSSSPLHTLSPSAAALHPTPVCCPSIHPSSNGPSNSPSTFPYASSFSSCSSNCTTTSSTTTTDRPPVDARHSLLPEETQPASSLPRQESR
ncbi:hypothetical protein EYF80_016701 [Liparis tanakae]|uniref:Uncharacterized protein n=1 Tax=Liparis tanakae TaxID=230148 RepID=A0A4Z2I5I2_9TELE|nr:hypothetical protein EYF80_016701 [Liparis tanakae]